MSCTFLCRFCFVLPIEARNGLILTFFPVLLVMFSCARLMPAENGQLPEDDKPKEEKIPKEEIDEDAPLVDSSEEEDSDEENEYEEDGFVVADNEDEDLPDVGSDQEREKRKSRLKRLRKGGKRKVRHLDDEDLELIAEHQGLAPSSKLRKTVADSEDPEAPSSISVAKAASVRTYSLLL